jgi:serine/threonine protein kinase
VDDPDKTVLPGQADPDRTVLPEAKTLPHPSGFTAGKQFGRYRIEKKLGEGGMGTVYLAHDTILDRPVALKIPIFGGNKEVSAARFLREAQAAAGLQHPNICPIYDVGQLEGSHYLCMQFVKGRPLADRVGPGRPLDAKEAARIIRSAALAMQAAHAKGIIHRDLKPVNIMMDERNEPIIMDFGLARRQDSGDKQLTMQGDIMGTPAYMPPEQVSGDVAKMGPASDIYALGIVLYELLTGEPPFKGEMFALLTQIAFDTPKPPSTRKVGLDPKFDSVTLKALAKKPEERWKSMQVFADMLSGLAGLTAPVSSQAMTKLDGPSISLKVVGTQFAYKPPPGLPIISIGRQKRKPGEAPELGNDFVLRVAGNDALSARISRRHLELHRTPTGYSVVDKSKTGVTKNGEALPSGTPVELVDGDLLNIAGVVTLEVSIRAAGHEDQGKQAAVVEVPAPVGAGGGQIHIEASLGDMMTMG